ncbi:MAG: hypothetical protein R3324_08060 [Halobacteriales archaeon]|nr:hypothetical protein [Halobacteriales archaeon]
MDDDEIRGLLTEIDGIGESRAQEVLDALNEHDLLEPPTDHEIALGQLRDHLNRGRDIVGDDNKTVGIRLSYAEERFEDALKLLPEDE